MYFVFHDFFHDFLWIVQSIWMVSLTFYLLLVLIIIIVKIWKWCIVGIFSKQVCCYGLCINVSGIFICLRKVREFLFCSGKSGNFYFGHWSQGILFWTEKSGNLYFVQESLGTFSLFRKVWEFLIWLGKSGNLFFSNAALWGYFWKGLYFYGKFIKMSRHLIFGKESQGKKIFFCQGENRVAQI